MDCENCENILSGKCYGCVKRLRVENVEQRGLLQRAYEYLHKGSSLQREFEQALKEPKDGKEVQQSG